MIKRLPLPIRFSLRHKRALYAVFALLWISGALWLAFHYFLSVPGEFGLAPHPLEKWWLRLHGLAAFAALVAVGSVLPIHARRAWHLRKNRGSGLAMKSVFLWLAASGYALYYFATDANETWLPLLHWAVGLSLPLMLILHIRLGRARAILSSQPASPEADLFNQPASPTSFGVASQPTAATTERTSHVLPTLQTRAAGGADRPLD